MDFECENWDIANEAHNLESSLFRDIQNKSNRKRKNGEAIKVDKDADQTTVNKKVKLTETSVKNKLDLQVGDPEWNKLSKKEKNNIRRKRSKMRRKLTNETESGNLNNKLPSNLLTEAEGNDTATSPNDGNAKKKLKIKNDSKVEKKTVNGNDRKLSVTNPTLNIESNSVTGDKKKMKTKRKGKFPDEGERTENTDIKSTKPNDDNTNSPQSGSPKGKKKRKRVCKRNKFKGYIKPERKDPPTNDALNDTNSSISDLNDTSNINSSSGNEVEKNETQSPKVAKKKKKVPPKEKTADVKLSPPPLSKTDNSKSSVTPSEVNKRTNLDANILCSILSPKVSEKQDVPRHDTAINNEHMNIGHSKSAAKSKSGQTFLDKSKERLNAARFRYLNEQLYTTTGKEAFQLFKHDKSAFDVYHEGFQSQVEKWPLNPIDLIIKLIVSKPKHLIIADFGCGDAKLARNVKQKVHSFDLVALNEHVTVCDMSKVPLKDGIVDIGVFCLSLMGTNLASYLKEANRVLKNNGTLLIAEVTSRFHSIGNFVMRVEKMGFKRKQQAAENKMFVMMEFKKTHDCKNKEIEEIKLKPCVYKKR
ncbi:25S rRNA (adenine645-N1)-methyltransferase [Mactra antiquata]